MNPRTKWLAIAGALVIGLYLLDSGYRSLIEQPTVQLTARIDALNSELQKAEEDQFVAKRAGKKLDAYAERALPRDPQLARSLYQAWLLELVEDCSIRSAAVDAAQPIAVETRSRVSRGKRITIGNRIAFSLRGRATLTTFSQFLDKFRQAGHLHKIRSVSLNPVGSEGEIDVNLAIEVLSLNASPRDNELSQWQYVQAANDGENDQQNLVGRNLFAKGHAKALYELRLKAITFNREGNAEAWFQLDRRGKVEPLATGQKFPLALYDIAVQEILPDRVLIALNQQPHWIQLGQTVGEIYYGVTVESLDVDQQPTTDEDTKQIPVEQTTQAKVEVDQSPTSMAR